MSNVLHLVVDSGIATKRASIKIQKHGKAIGLLIMSTGAIILTIKALQNEINELEDRIKKLDERVSDLEEIAYFENDEHRGE